jgi:hypothetical protein
LEAELAARDDDLADCAARLAAAEARIKELEALGQKVGGRLVACV